MYWGRFTCVCMPKAWTSIWLHFLNHSAYNYLTSQRNSKNECRVLNFEHKMVMIIVYRKKTRCDHSEETILVIIVFVFHHNKLAIGLNIVERTQLSTKHPSFSCFIIDNEDDLLFYLREGRMHSHSPNIRSQKIQILSLYRGRAAEVLSHTYSCGCLVNNHSFYFHAWGWQKAPDVCS